MSAQINRGHRKHRHSAGIRLTGTYDCFVDVKRQCNWFISDRKMPIYSYPKTTKEEITDDNSEEN